MYPRRKQGIIKKNLDKGVMFMKPRQKLFQNLPAILLLGVLAVYFAAICLINFSGRPGFYNTDMYTDMVFAGKVWQQKSLLPAGWLFGNQLYVAATPTLAALYCGIADSLQTAMALAAVTMTVLIILSFWWLLSAVSSRKTEGLFCVTLFFTLGLYFGDSCGTETGWQLFFTMCAYYACYLIDVLLAFGCYLRADKAVGKRFWAVVMLTGLLSFAMGIQSLRQVAVMGVPLVCVAGLQLLADIRQGKNWRRRSLWVALGLFLCNLLGLAVKQVLPIEQTEIFGTFAIAPLTEMPSALQESLQTMVNLLDCETGAAKVLRGAVLLLTVAAGAEQIWQEWKHKATSERGRLLALLVLSLLMILGIDVVTILDVRSIYYFLLYVLIAWLLAVGYRNRKVWQQWVILGLMLICLVLPSLVALKDVCMQAYFAKYDKAYEVSEYLMGQGYTTVYARWNLGEDVAIASNCQIEVGFWDEVTFEQVEYLCDPAVYEADADSCAYLMFGSEAAQLGEAEAAKRGVTLTQVAYLDENDVYIYTASENLMHKAEK